MDRHPRDRLRRELSLQDSVFLVVASVVGSGIFLTPGAIADRLRRLAGDHGLRRTMAQAARELVAARFDVRKRVAALEDIYDEVASSFAAES